MKAFGYFAAASVFALAGCSHADHAMSPTEIGIAAPGQPAIISHQGVQDAKAPVDVPVPSTAVPRATDAGAQNHEGGELTVQ